VSAPVDGDVDAGEIEPQRGDRAERKRTGRRRRTHASAEGAQSDVRPPFARQGAALDRADEVARGDEYAEVAARRLDERLHERTMATEPPSVLEAFEPRAQLALRATEKDVAAPAAEARLDDVRWRKRRDRRLADVCRARLRNSGPAKEQGGRELVVGHHQTTRTVDDLYSATLQPRQLPQTGLDPVERRQDIESREREIAFPKERRRGCVGEPGARCPRSAKAAAIAQFVSVGLPSTTTDRRRSAGRADRAAPLAYRSIVISMLVTLIEPVQQPRLSPA
jgi:hypothetical protein